MAKTFRWAHLAIGAILFLLYTRPAYSSVASFTSCYHAEFLVSSCQTHWNEFSKNYRVTIQAVNLKSRPAACYFDSLFLLTRKSPPPPNQVSLILTAADPDSCVHLNDTIIKGTVQEIYHCDGGSFWGLRNVNAIDRRLEWPIIMIFYWVPAVILLFPLSAIVPVVIFSAMALLGRKRGKRLLIFGAAVWLLFAVVGIGLTYLYEAPERYELRTKLLSLAPLLWAATVCGCVGLVRGRSGSGSSSLPPNIPSEHSRNANQIKLRF